MPKPAPRAGVKRALDQEQLTLFYQPIHELDSRRIIAAEALLRARRQSGEIRSAVSIAAGAEQGPDLFRLDSWMMRQAFADARRWQAAAPGVRLHVNLSPREFQEGNVPARLEKLTEGFPALNLEITETASFDRAEEAVRILDDLRKRGIELWLDDFGTGHSSISHLLHFSVNGVKVPGEFVADLPGSARSVAIVRHIIGLAHDLGCAVIAEGVENGDQLAALREMKCDRIQGFLFSRPMEADALLSLIR